MKRKGIFITFEGGEGSGKSTQMKMLNAALVSLGKPVVLTREPGGCPGAESIRKLLVKGNADKWHPLAETLLFLAARVENVHTIIKPALAKKKIVLCDRFVDSTLVYQGLVKGLGIEYVRNLYRVTLRKLMPDLTFLLDIDPAIGLQRASSRPGKETRFETMDKSFHKQVRKGFLRLAKKEPKRFVVINAEQSPYEVHDAVIDVFKRRFG